MSNPPPNHAELVERLRRLLSLDRPEFGGPYRGFAAEDCIKAMGEAADALTASQARIADLEAKLGEAREALATETEACRKIAYSEVQKWDRKAEASSDNVARIELRCRAIGAAYVHDAIRARSILPTRGE